MTLVNDYLLYLAAGAVAGLLGGMLGIGGGTIIVPVLAFIFHAHGYAPEVLTHMAVGTSLATIIFTSISSVRAHHQRGAVDWNAVQRIAPGLVVGSLLGAQIAHALPARTLQLVIGAFAWTMAAQMLSGWQAKAHRQLPGGASLFGAGGIIGTASAIFGIGGGSLMVPYLSYHNVIMQRAVATASACGLPIAVAGAVGFMIAGWHEARLPPQSLGFVYLPALLGIALSSMIFARIGAHFAHRLPAATLKKVFAGLLLIVGLQFMLGLK